MKGGFFSEVPTVSFVSNPWREAIEGANSVAVVTVVVKFPILGGRLLKKCSKPF